MFLNGKNSCFIEDALMMSFQSSNQDSSPTTGKQRKKDRPFSSHLSTHSGTFQTKKKNAMTSLSRKSTLSQQVETSSGRRLLDQFSPSTRQSTTVLANQIPCHNCKQLCAGRLHPQSNFSKRRTNFIRETLHASCRTEDCTQACLAIAAATAPAARHIGRVLLRAPGNVKK